jgi:hypothetical protein
MLHDAEARHLEFLLELSQRLPITLEELVEQETSRRIAERLEDQIIVHHGRDDM